MIADPPRLFEPLLLFPMSLLSELVSFHSRQHLEDLNNSCHLLFMYLLIREGANARLLVGRVNEDIRWVQSSFSIPFHCNSVMELASAWAIMDQLCSVVAERIEEGLFFLLFLFLTVWMSASLRHFSRTTQKEGWNTRRASGQGFPQPPSLIPFTALSSDSSHKQTD